MSSLSDLDTAGPDAPRWSTTPLHLQILGPLRVWRYGVEVDPGPRQRSHLMALLLARQGCPVSTGDLIDLLWDDDPPASALNVVQKYIGSVRRLLEPDLAARDPGSYLLRRGDSYLFAPGSGVLDLERFRGRVRDAAIALSDGRSRLAADHLIEALSLWHGPAGDGIHLGHRATSVFTGLNEEFFETCVRATDLAAAAGQLHRVLPALRLASHVGPLHEPVHAGLVTALGDVGQRSEALRVFDAVRTRLRDELGIDPGDALRLAHRRVLAEPPAIRRRPDSSRAMTAQNPARHADQSRHARGRASVTGPDLIGRAAECALLRRTLEPLYTGGIALTLIEGEPGVGKTRLLDFVAADAASRGALVAWGNCLQGSGTPSLWPWLKIFPTLLGTLPPATRHSLNTGLAPLAQPEGGILDRPVEPDTNARFRLFDDATSVIAEIAVSTPVLIILDDLHWADVASLRLLDHLMTHLPSGSAIVCAFRDRAPTPSPDLAGTLATASRARGHRRLLLGPLSIEEVASLIRAESGAEISRRAVLSVHARTGGNPFFVREVARMLGDADGTLAGDTSRSSIPGSVRDVVRGRMADLEPRAGDMLQAAALIGRRVELRLLAQVCGQSVPDCLVHIESCVSLGLLDPVADDPYLYRFTHDLVREAVLEATPPSRTALLHLRTADALTGMIDESHEATERIAQHLWSAGPSADPARTVTALIRASRLAVVRTALETAERSLRLAVETGRKANEPELELSALSELTALTGRRSMYGLASVELLQRAEHLATRLGRQEEATVFLFSRWTAHCQGLDSVKSRELARQLLDLADTSHLPLVRAFGWQAWGLQRYSDGHLDEAREYMVAAHALLGEEQPQGTEEPGRRQLELHSISMLAEVTAVSGDLDAARSLMAQLEQRAGDEPFALTIWAAHAVRIGAMAGDVAAVLRGAERGLMSDPEFSFRYLGIFVRLGMCWARVMTGSDIDRSIAEAERLINTRLLNPVGSCVALCLGFLAEMKLVSGDLHGAQTTLDFAFECLETYDQRYAEGMLVQMRARIMRASGAHSQAIRSVTEQARSISELRGSHLFADERSVS